MMHHTMKAGS